MDLLKVLRFPYQKKLRNKGHLNLETEVYSLEKITEKYQELDLLSPTVTTWMK